MIGTGGSAVCWIDHKTTPFDNLYRGRKWNPENLIRKDEKWSEKSNLLRRKHTLWMSAPRNPGARFAYADETIDFRRVMSRISHVIQKTAGSTVPIKFRGRLDAQILAAPYVEVGVCEEGSNVHVFSDSHK